MLGLLSDSVIFFLIFCYLILGTCLSILHVPHLRAGHRESKKRFAFPSLFLYHVLNFYLIFNLLTFPPSDTGGHGNPVIPYIAVSAVIFLFFCIAVLVKTYKVLQSKHSLTKYLTLFFSFTALILSIYFQLEFMNDIKNHLAGPMGEWRNWWKDPRLNSLYFNLFTFILLISLSVLSGAVGSLFQKGRNLHFFH